MKKIIILSVLIILLTSVVSAETLGEWKLQECPQTHLGFVTDSSGNNNHGKFFTNEGVVDKCSREHSAYTFDGIDDYILLPAGSTTLSSYETIVLSANIYLKSYAPTQQSPIIIDRTVSNGDFQFVILPDNHVSAHKLLFSIWDNTGKSHSVTSTTSIPLNKWITVKAQYDGTHMKVFIDDQEEGMLNIPDLTINSKSTDLRIGGDVFGAPQFHGFIKDVSMATKEVTCTDSDGGNNYYEIGRAEEVDGSGTFDTCTFLEHPKGRLREAVCEDGKATHNEVNCPESAPYCNRGMCGKSKPVCTDSDGGNNIYVPGTIVEPRLHDGPEHIDYCQNINNKLPWNSCEGDLCGIREFYCTDPYVTTTYADVSCPDGCQNGACIKKLDAPIVTEQVTCHFGGAHLIHNCYPSNIDLECSDIESCILEISDEEGKEIVWKSSCGGYQTTRMDGANEEIVFDCTQELECEAKDVLDEGETKLYTINGLNYEISASYISFNEVKLKINGELTDSLSEGESFKLQDGLIVTNLDIITTNLAGEVDRVEFCVQMKQTCTDSDGGKDYFERGATSYTINEQDYKSVEICTYQGLGPTTGEIGDSVIESWCELNSYRVEEHLCEYGCKTGACLKERVNIPIECGNDICEGSVNTGECVTCPNDCSPAQCQPLPEQCSGCLKDSICLPLGTRTMDGDVPKYCDREQGLITQKAVSEVCMNNYECRANVCVDETCYNVTEEIEIIKEEVGIISTKLQETRELVQWLLDWVMSAVGVGPEVEECTDSDGGKDYYIKGTIIGPLVSGTISEDTCAGDDVRELFCNANDKGEPELFTCPNGCEDGACIGNTIEYKMAFVPEIKSDHNTGGTGYLEDIKNKKITFLGNTYTVIAADHPAQNHLKFIFMGGAVTDVIDEGETKTYTVNGKEYQVTASYISDSEAKMKVNGELTDSLSETGTYQLIDGMQVGIIDIMGQNLAGEVDRVEFSLGANKLEIEDKNTANSGWDAIIKIDGSVSNDLEGEIITSTDEGTSSGNDVKLSSIKFKYNLDTTSGESNSLITAITSNDLNLLQTTSFTNEYATSEVIQTLNGIGPEPVIEKCTDGTLHGKCSTTKPNRCIDGTLIKDCTICGCDLDNVCQTTGVCTKIPTSENQVFLDDFDDGILDLSISDVHPSDSDCCFNPPCLQEKDSKVIIYRDPSSGSCGENLHGEFKSMAGNLERWGDVDLKIVLKEFYVTQEHEKRWALYNSEIKQMCDNLPAYTTTPTDYTFYWDATNQIMTDETGAYCDISSIHSFGEGLFLGTAGFHVGSSFTKSYSGVEVTQIH